MDFFKSPSFLNISQGLMDEFHVPGLAVAVVQNGTIASRAFGHAILDPPKPCTADTLFDVASTSKSMTAASVAIIVSDNSSRPQVRWDSVVSKLLPDDFVLSDKVYTDLVTVDDIISHRTGLPSHEFALLSNRSKTPDNSRSVTRNLRNLQIVAPLRTKYIYNNMMITVASYLVEKVSGMAFADYLEKTFFGPLGMKSSHLFMKRAREAGLGDRIATGYEWNDKTEKFKGFQDPDYPESQGAGSISTSANDYIKWVKALMNREGPITEDIYAELIRSRSFTDNVNAATARGSSSTPAIYGAGMEHYYYRGNLVISHDGSVPGFNSLFFFMPGSKFGAVLFTNSGSGSDVISSLVERLMDSALGLAPVKKPTDGGGDGDGGGEGEDPEKAMLEDLCPGQTQKQPQKNPLGDYTGDYSNKGYRVMTVQNRNGSLYIDGSERSLGFTMTMAHACNQTKFIGHSRDFLVGGEDLMAVEFELGSGGKAKRLGMKLEEEIDGNIWFDKVEGGKERT